MTKMQKKAAKTTWSPAARAKRMATFAAKRAAKAAGLPAPGRKPGRSLDTSRDVIVFLEKAEAAILKSGGKRISAAESYAMLALTTLRGN